MINEVTYSHLPPNLRRGIERFEEEVAAGIIWFDAEGHTHYPAAGRTNVELHDFVMSKVPDWE